MSDGRSVGCYAAWRRGVVGRVAAILKKNLSGKEASEDWSFKLIGRQIWPARGWEMRGNLIVRWTGNIGMTSFRETFRGGKSLICSLLVVSCGRATKTLNSNTLETDCPWPSMVTASILTASSTRQEHPPPPCALRVAPEPTPAQQVRGPGHDCSERCGRSSIWIPLFPTSNLSFIHCLFWQLLIIPNNYKWKALWFKGSDEVCTLYDKEQKPKCTLYKV